MVGVGVGVGVGVRARVRVKIGVGVRVWVRVRVGDPVEHLAVDADGDVHARVARARRALSGPRGESHVSPPRRGGLSRHGRRLDRRHLPAEPLPAGRLVVLLLVVDPG